MHLVIPDSQCKPGAPLDHMRWAGRYILEKKPDVIVDLGDTWDMESMSEWDRGKFQFEGRRYKADIEAGNAGVRLLDKPTVDARIAGFVLAARPPETAKPSAPLPTITDMKGEADFASARARLSAEIGEASCATIEQWCADSRAKQ